MTANAKIDRDKLHRALFEKANRAGHVEVKLLDLAELLGIRADHLGRIMKEMAADGRIEKISTARHRVSTWKIVDPDEWTGTKGGHAAKREIKWG